MSNKKTVHMAFSSRPIPDPPIIKNGNETLKYVTSFKYLGVTIDQNLKHFSHLKMLISYMKQQVGMISCNPKFFNFQASVTYYFTYIYSKLNYGINSWGGVLLAHGASNELKTLHSRVVKLLFGRFFNFANANTIFRKLQLLKLEDMYKFNLMITMFNILKTDRIPFLYQKISTFGFQHSYNTRNNNLRIPLCCNAFFHLISYIGQ